MEAASKRKLVASAVLTVVSLALLVGLTFAWFTDSAKSTGNKISAGTLDISATVAQVDAGKATYSIEGVNGGEAFGFGEATDINESDPIISEDLWEPGKSNAKLVTVKNNGSLAAKVKLQFDVVDGSDLQDALWFDFVQVKADGTVVGQFERKSFSAIQTQAGALELPLAAAGAADGSDSVSFILVYGMDEAAGNEYQGKTFTADVTIVATQDTVEADGFGNTEYDASAAYPEVASVASAADLKSALESDTGSPVDVTIEQPVGSITDRIASLNVTGDVTLTVPAFGNDEGFYARNLTVKDGGSLTVNGEWQSGGRTSSVNVNSTIAVDGAGSTLTLNNVYSAGVSGYQQTGFAATNGGTLNITAGCYGTSGANGTCVLADGGTVVITGGSFNASGYQSVGFAAQNGGKIVIAKSVYESTTINGSKIPDTCQAVLDGDTYVITEKTA